MSCTARQRPTRLAERGGSARWGAGSKNGRGRKGRLPRVPEGGAVGAAVSPADLDRLGAVSARARCLAGAGVLGEGRGDREREGRAPREGRRGLGGTGGGLAARARQRRRRLDQSAARVGLLLSFLSCRAGESAEAPESAKPGSAGLPLVLGLCLVPQRRAGVRERCSGVRSVRIPDRPLRVAARIAPLPSLRRCPSGSWSPRRCCCLDSAWG
jgi:hypothetical protein